MSRAPTSVPSTPPPSDSNLSLLIAELERLLQNITISFEQASSYEEKILLHGTLTSVRHLIKLRTSSGDMPSIMPNLSPTSDSMKEI